MPDPSLFDEGDAPPAEVPAVVSPAVQEGRDPVNGRFLPGNKLAPGRPPGRPDVYVVAQDWAKRKGTDIRHELGEVIGVLLAEARSGNVEAAKVLLNRLTLADSQLVAAFSVELSDTERTVRLQAILARAAARITEEANED